MDTKTALIGRLPLFAGLSTGELRSVAAVADEVDLPAGRTLAAEGAAGREFVVLLEGSAVVEQEGRSIAALGPGDFLGEIALVTRMRRTATVTTTSPVRVLVVGDRAFRNLQRTVPLFNSRVWAAAAERLSR